MPKRFTQRAGRVNYKLTIPVCLWMLAITLIVVILGELELLREKAIETDSNQSNSSQIDRKFKESITS